MLLIILVLAGLLVASLFKARTRTRPARAAASTEIAAIVPIVAEAAVSDELPQTDEDAALLADDLLYGPLLLAAKEPSIARAARDRVSVLRLTWLRGERTSFTVRITWGPLRTVLVAHAVEDGEGLCGTPVIRRSVTGQVSQEQQASVDAALHRASFWALSGTSPHAEADTWCRVESTSGGLLHAVERSEDGELAEIAMVMMGLSGLRFDPEQS